MFNNENNLCLTVMPLAQNQLTNLFLEKITQFANRFWKQDLNANIDNFVSELLLSNPMPFNDESSNILITKSLVQAVIKLNITLENFLFLTQ